MKHWNRTMALLLSACVLTGCGGSGEVTGSTQTRGETQDAAEQGSAGETRDAAEQGSAGETPDAAEQGSAGETRDAAEQGSAGETQDVPEQTDTKAPGEEQTVEGTASREEQTVESVEKQQEDDEMKEKEQDIEVKCPAYYTEYHREVTYGELIRTSYYSTTCEKERKVNILLPAGYDESREYPVLYLLHGIFGDENSMVGGKTSGNCVTIGNMIADGTAKEMIVVFPYMYASKTKDACTAIDEENVAAYDNFVNDLKDDLMPFMRENYSIAEGRENTAIAGFSMGGRESLAIALQCQELIGYVGAIAPAPGLVPGKDWAMAHKGQFAPEELVFDKEKPLVFMICCGDSDKTVGTFPASYHRIFEENGQDRVWWEIPGSDHGDPAISSGIYNYCRSIFQ